MQDVLICAAADGTFMTDGGVAGMRPCLELLGEDALSVLGEMRLAEIQDILLSSPALSFVLRSLISRNPQPATQKYQRVRDALRRIK